MSVCVVAGPVGAGKTIWALRACACARGGGFGTALFVTHPLDAAEGNVGALARVWDAWRPGDAEQTTARLFDALEPVLIEGIECDTVVVGAGHLFGGAMAEYARRLARVHVRVFVATLDEDEFGAPLPACGALVACADEVVKLAPPCARCGARARHSFRYRDPPRGVRGCVVAASEPRRIVDGALCRRCYRERVDPASGVAW
jgi:thymidine kinase